MPFALLNAETSAIAWKKCFYEQMALHERANTETKIAHANQN